MLNISRKLFNFQSLLKCLASLERSACSGRFPQLVTQETLQNTSNEESPKGGYGEKEIFLLGPADIRTPLPGNMGIPPLPVLYIDTLSQLPGPAGKECEVTTSQLPEERYRTLLTQAAAAAEATVNDQSSYNLECIGYDCPQLLRNDFSDLFPSRDMSTGNLTVITLCQRTENNMSEWSEKAEIERADLLSCFMMNASDICIELKCNDYWADFIHPNSGKPNFDSLTSATMFETDFRYRNLGFTIEDLGCCRIVLHKEWGTHMFVGAVFTNAPLQSKEIQKILNRYNKEQ